MGRTKRCKPGGARRRQDKADFNPVTKTNELFEKFYKAQGIIPETEWDDFMASLRAPLPMTFRFTGGRSHAVELKNTMKREFFAHMENLEIDGEKVEAPSALPWYPEELAWKVNLPRTVVRKSAELRRFHKFLVSETEIGNISRQESVSMIPPLVLEAQPNEWALDMCAAPGSKTAQLIEAVHDDPTKIPTGLVVANDANYKRAYMLAHQVRRLQSPAMLVCNHDATAFPTLAHANPTDPTGPAVPALFDRVLCDVPCSGDGTIRKNPLIWREWTPSGGVGLHPTQLKILFRGAQLLKVGGRLVYSTCSLNPVENEAVVAEALKQCNGALKLVDVSASLPDLKRIPGLYSWKVMDKANEVHDSFENVPDRQKKKITRSMFPPANPEELNLEHCLRIYPHLQDTGGFFVAVFEKIAPMSKTDRSDAEVADNRKRDRSPSAVEVGAEDGEDTKRARTDESTEDLTAQAESADTMEKDEAKQSAQGKAKKGHPSTQGPHELPIFMVDAQSDDVKSVSLCYGLSPEFPRDQFVTRTAEDAKIVSFVSSGARSLIVANPHERLKTVVTGVKVFVRQSASSMSKHIATKGEDEEAVCPLRLSSDGLGVLLPYLSEKRRVQIALDDLTVMLKEEYPRVQELSEDLQKRLESIGRGCLVFEYIPDASNAATTNLNTNVVFPAWRAPTSLNMLLNKEEKRSLTHRVLGMPDEEVADLAPADSKADEDVVESKEEVGASELDP